MNVFWNFDEINFDTNTVLTVGTFDGVHRGHQYIIKNLLEVSKQDSLRNLIITMHPHPQIVLNKKGLPPVHLLTSISERLNLFENYGIDNVLVIPFTYEFSQTPARDFVVDYLVSKIGVKKILIGYDHLFGKDRAGNEDLLKELSTEYDFDIVKLGRVDLENHRISSTEIRTAVQNSDIHIANNLLGHHYAIRGKVIHGQKRGRTMGFPTANMEVDDPNKLIPKNGVYFVSANIKGEEVWGMANIGYRPTVTNERVLSIEANFFDFDEDIYDLHITIRFIKKIRDEHKFSGIDALIAQLNNDKETCLELIKNKDFS